MFELKDGLNFHNFYRDCQSEVWFKRRKGEATINWLMRVSYQPADSLLDYRQKNEYWLDSSFKISLAVCSFLAENRMQKETLDELCNFEIDLSGKHDFTLSELRRLELYTNLKFLL